MRHDEINSLKSFVFSVSRFLTFDIFSFIFTGDHKYLCGECAVQLLSQPNARRCHSCRLGAREFVTKRHEVCAHLRDIIPDGEDFVQELHKRELVAKDDGKMRSKNQYLAVLKETKEWCFNIKGRPWISIRGEKELLFKNSCFIVTFPILHNICSILKTTHQLLVTHYLQLPAVPNATKVQLEEAFRGNLRRELTIHLGCGFWNGEVYRRVFSFHRKVYKPFLPPYLQVLPLFANLLVRMCYGHVETGTVSQLFIARFQIIIGIVRPFIELLYINATPNAKRTGTKEYATNNLYWHSLDHMLIFLKKFKMPLFLLNEEAFESLFRHAKHYVRTRSSHGDDELWRNRVWHAVQKLLQEHFGKDRAKEQFQRMGPDELFPSVFFAPCVFSPGTFSKDTEFLRKELMGLYIKLFEDFSEHCKHFDSGAQGLYRVFLCGEEGFAAAEMVCLCGDHTQLPGASLQQLLSENEASLPGQAQERHPKRLKTKEKPKDAIVFPSDIFLAPVVSFWEQYYHLRKEMKYFQVKFMHAHQGDTVPKRQDYEQKGKLDLLLAMNEAMTMRKSKALELQEGVISYGNLFFEKNEKFLQVLLVNQSKKRRRIQLSCFRQHVCAFCFTLLKKIFEHMFRCTSQQKTRRNKHQRLLWESFIGQK
jgi:hypothetical protein